jgi:LPXTG-motif cell wall-anchored protein
VIKNANGTVVDTKTSTSSTLNYTQTTPGKYTVQATVTVTVNGQDKTVTSNGCKGAFEVPTTPGDITVCELATKKIVTIKESAFDPSKYSKNLDDCKETPPVTPPELPKTGMGENIVAILGLGALIASAAYYVASRRALNQ